MPLRETLDNLRSSPVPSNEQEVITEILLILQALGWDLLHQVKREYPVGRGRVDIALSGPDRVVAFIEAKASRVNLDRHVEQVVRYAFHEGVDICVLTNGLEWWLYLPMLSVPFEERRFVTSSIRTDPVKQIQDNLVTFLSRKNLVSGAARKAAERHRKLNKAIPEAWRKILTGPDDGLLDLVGQRVNERVGLKPTRREVERVLRPFLVPPSPAPPVPQRPGPEPMPAPDPAVPPRPPSDPGDKPRRFRIWATTYPYRSWSDLSFRVAEELYARHGADFDRVLRLAGSTHPYASRYPADLREPGEVGRSGYYLDKVHFRDSRRHCVHQLLEAFGYRRTDLEILYD